LGRIIIQNTLSAAAVIGVTPGYFHENERTVNLTALGILYQDTAEKIFIKTKMYCGSIISPCRIVYREGWGCPQGGENVIYIAADCNPSYDKERPAAEFIAAWKETFISILEALMIELGQKTVTVKFSDGELVYLTK